MQLEVFKKVFGILNLWVILFEDMMDFVDVLQILVVDVFEKFDNVDKNLLFFRVEVE